MKFTYPDSQVPHTSYAYNNSGNTINFTWHNTIGGAMAGGSFGYDARERVIRVNSSISGNYFYHINVYNQRVHKTTFSQGSKQGSGAVYSFLYDENGQLIAETMPDATTLGSLYIYNQGEIVGLERIIP